MNFATCSLCKEQGHNAAKCPDLVDPLKPGFSGAGGGGGGGHSHDDDEGISLFDTPKLIHTLWYTPISTKNEKQRSLTKINK